MTMSRYMAEKQEIIGKKLSQLIKELQNLEKEHGDIPVCSYRADWDYWEPIHAEWTPCVYMANKNFGQNNYIIDSDVDRAPVNAIGARVR